MWDEPSLLSLFESDQKWALSQMLLQLLDSPGPYPLDELLILLRDSVDEELSDAVFNVLYEKLSPLEPELIERYPELSLKLQFTVLYLWAQKPSHRVCRFVLRRYLSDPEFRSFIEDRFFSNRSLLLWILAEYVQTQPLNPEALPLILNLLKRVPASVYREFSASLRYSKIADLYYRIPPEDRITK